MRERPDILRDPPEELNPELYKPHFDWEEEERILAEKEKRQEDNEAFLDNVIMYEVLSELRDIAARKGISCACGSRRYGMEVRRSAVDLICRDCGARLRVPAATDRDLDDLCCHMKLVLPGKK